MFDNHLTTGLISMISGVQVNHGLLQKWAKLTFVSVLIVAANQLMAETAVVDLVFDKLASQSHKDTSFVEEKYSTFLDEPLVMAGKLKYRAPDTVIREQEAPDQIRFVITGNTVKISENGQSKTVKLDGLPSLFVLIDSLRAMLAGDYDRLKKYYDIKFSGSVSSWSMLLIPLANSSANSSGAYIEKIIFAGEVDRINKIEIHEDDENWSVMQLKPLQ